MNKSKNHYLKPLKTLIGFLLSFSSALGQNGEHNSTVHIPEPLMFDLVRGLGARQGELEVNSLADFPLNYTTTRGIDWAPEVEYALFKKFLLN